MREYVFLYGHDADLHKTLTVIAQEIGAHQAADWLGKTAPLDNLMLLVYGFVWQYRLGCCEKDDYECVANITGTVFCVHCIHGFC
jgi:hypothetical protein